MSSLHYGVLKLFRGSQIKVEKRYSKLSINNLEDYLDLKAVDDSMRIIPLEASIALNKLYSNDIKGFMEAHIDSHVCTPLVSLCREYGPRIKCSIYIDDEYVELYSECFDVEVLSSIVFGDLSNLFIFEIGYREGKRFKRVTIPRKLISQLAPLIAKWERDRLRSQLSIPSHETLDEVIKYVLNEGSRITELIIHIPCLNDEAVGMLYSISRELSNRSRVYILTMPPSQNNVERCQLDRATAIVSYLEVLELSSRHNMIICDVDVMHIGFILNRAHYIVSYEYSYRGGAETSMIKDKSYIEVTTQNFLRDCLCSNNLIRNERSYSYRLAYKA